MESEPDVLGVIGVIALFALFVIAVYMGMRVFAENECVQAGFATIRMVKGERLCIGVVDDEWAVQPLVEIREGLK